jgi:3-hydroxyacyl-[acyl-carrier-protein] dehydratase
VKFILVDRLLSVEPARSIKMAKQVSMAEEYLADHFPRFPVLPGVLMLEAAVQAAAWVVREWDQFHHSVIVLRGVWGIRYGAFVEPGATLVVQADVIKLESGKSEFKIRGTVSDAVAIQGRIELAHLNLTDQDAGLAAVDGAMVAAMRSQWHELSRRLGV